MRDISFFSEDKYVHLPSKTNPRVSLAVSDVSTLLNSFKLYNPFSVKARVLKKASQFVLKKAPNLFLGKAHKKSDFVAYLEQVLEIKLKTSVYWATSKDKVVLQLQSNKKVYGYLKFPQNEAGLKNIQNEKKAFKILSEYSIIPPLMCSGTYKNIPYILLSELKGAIGLIDEESVLLLLNKFKKEKKIKAQQRLIIKLDYEHKLKIEEDEKKRMLHEKNEKVRINKIIADKNEALKEANQTKDYLFGIIAHDLRKPAIAFRGISKKVAYLLENKDYERLEKLGHYIEQDALALNLLTDNLLNWALHQKEAIRYKASTFFLNEITTDLQSIFLSAAKRKNVNLTFKIDLKLKIHTDKNLLQTCLRNLLDNAIKYCKPNDMIAITLKKLKASLSIRVKDTGVGMSEETLKNIFSIHKNKSQIGTAGEKGTGFGLNLVQNLVDLLGGKLLVKSTINKGTEFRIDLSNTIIRN